MGENQNNENFQIDKWREWSNRIRDKARIDSKAVDNFSAQLTEFGRELSEKIKDAFSQFNQISEMIQEAQKNPDSTISYMKYQECLDKFHWVWPYGITGKEIKSILEDCQAEYDFDKYMQRYFTKRKVQSIFEDVCNRLSGQQKMLFKQIEHAYWSRNYAIANNALVSIIDNMLRRYMYNPGSIKRKGVIEPMMDYYGWLTPKEAPFYLRMKMLSNCINFIFQKYDLSHKTPIDTNKKIRRHAAVHGARYSNNRIDTLLLVNTLYEIIYHQKYMRPFEGSIEVSNNGKAKINEEKKRTVKKRIQKSGIIN